MTIPQLGTLETVDLRKAWHHEAHSFTPWLAAHLDALASAIGIPLELEGREVAVDTFSADILARNTSDGSLVLIENQLEVTDHSHLGQVMTYLAGLEAQMVIWIAKDFRDAHLSAVNWLNEHTVDPFAFFAVRVKVVRIGNSPLAPVFELLAKPNEWERQLQSKTQQARTTNRATGDLYQFRRDFWQHYADRHPAIAHDTPAGGNSNRWRTVAESDLRISSYLAQQSVGVFIRGKLRADPGDLYSKLAPHAATLKAKLGTELKDESSDHHFSARLPIDTSDRSRWDEIVDWLNEQTNKYEQVLLELGI